MDRKCVLAEEEHLRFGEAALLWCGGEAALTDVKIDDG